MIKRALFYIALLLPFVASAQIPALNDTTLYSGSTAFTPQFRFKAVTLSGFSYRIPQVYNPILGKYDSYVTTKYLSAFYAPLSGLGSYVLKADSGNTPDNYVTFGKFKSGTQTLYNKTLHSTTVYQGSNAVTTGQTNEYGLINSNGKLALGTSNLMYNGTTGFTDVGFLNVTEVPVQNGMPLRYQEGQSYYTNLRNYQKLNTFLSVSNGGSPKTGNLPMGKTQSLVLDSTDATLDSRPAAIMLNKSTLVTFYATTPMGTIRYKMSTDVGKTWGAQTTALTDASLNGEINATLLPNGTIYLSFFKNDGSGIGYSIGTVVGNSITFSAPVFFTSPFNEYVYTSGPVQPLSNGNLIMPIWGKNTADTYNTAAVQISTDNGATWGSKINVATTIGEGTGFTECQLTQLPNNKIVIIMRSAISVGFESYGKYYRSVSTDNGATWSTATVALDIVRVGRPTLTHTASGGLFLVCRGNVSASLNARNVYQTSWDEGVTWTAPIALDNTPEVGLYKIDDYDALINLSGGNLGLVSNIQTVHTDGPTYKYQLKYFEFTDGAGLMSNGNVIAKSLTADSINIGTTAIKALLGVQDSVTVNNHVMAEFQGKDVVSGDNVYVSVRKGSGYGGGATHALYMGSDALWGRLVANDFSRNGDIRIKHSDGKVMLASLLPSKPVFTASDTTLTNTGPGSTSQLIDGTGALQTIPTSLPTTNSVTFNNSGSGDASGTTFNGGTAKTVSYNTIGAQPTISFGTGVLSALSNNIGSSGAPVLFNGAGGAPSSLTLTNATGLPLSTGVNGTLAIGNGGTNSTTASDARANLGLAIGSDVLAYRTFGTAANNNTGDFEVPLTFSTGLTRSTNTITVNTSQNITNLTNLNTAGFVKTTGTGGALSIDNSTYLTGNESITLSGDVSGSGATAITTTIGAGKVTNAMLAGSIDLTTKVTGVLPSANGGIPTSLAAPANGDILQYNGTNWVNATVTATAPLQKSGPGAGGTWSITQANTSTNGYLSSTDWNTFNNKLSTATAASTYYPIAGVTAITGALNVTYANPRFNITATTATNPTYTAFVNNETGYTGLDNSAGSEFGGSAYSFNHYLAGNHDMNFFTSATRRMVISGAGALRLNAYGAGVLQTDGSGNVTAGAALANGTTATTQSAGDNSTKVATTAYVDARSLSGTYTPTTTNGTNVTTSNGITAYYTRVGDIVTVSGTCSVTPTSTGFGEINISLPIASNLGGTTDVSGIGMGFSTNIVSATLRADTGADNAIMSFTVNTASVTNMTFNFTYKVI